MITSQPRRRSKLGMITSQPLGVITSQPSGRSMLGVITNLSSRGSKLGVITSQPSCSKHGAAHAAAAEAAEEAAAWPVDPTAVGQFCTMFAEACAAQGAGVDRLGKAQAGAVLTSSGLPTQVLLQIWSLADIDGDDRLDLQE